MHGKGKDNEYHISYFKKWDHFILNLINQRDYEINLIIVNQTRQLWELTRAPPKRVNQTRGKQIKLLKEPTFAQ